MNSKILKELQERVDDSMESVEAIQGAGFRNLLAHVMACSQAMRMLAAVHQKYADDEQVDATAKSMASVLAKGSSLLADAYDINEDRCEELMKWVETLDNHILEALKEDSK